MRLYIILLLSVALAGVNFCQNKLTKADLKTSKDKISYCIGVNIGKNYKPQSKEADTAHAYSEALGHAEIIRNIVEVDSAILACGLKDGFSADPAVQPLFTEEEVNQVLSDFQKETAARQKEKGEKNKAEGDNFLAENRKKEGVITLPSGLQYKIIKSGTGKSPKATDSVTVHYTGTLINGKKFDSSFDRNEPITFLVTGVIKGWVEALQLMKEGDAWELYIPSELAYGESGASDDIGPNTVLIFYVELIKVR